jgi:transposase
VRSSCNQAQGGQGKRPSWNREETSPRQQNVCTVGSDLAKNIFHLVGTDATGQIVWRKRLTRHALGPLLAQLPPVPIGMEACGGAHAWARPWRPPEPD